MALDLNEKPWYVALLIGLGLGAALLFAVNHYFFKDIRKNITRTEDSIQKLEREVEKGRAAQRDLPKLEEEIQEREIELDRLRRILPTKRETDDLIKKLKQLTERGRFSLIRFRPGEFVDQDFYWEWPIDVVLDGTYHELGLLFDRLSRFSRIINVDKLNITPYRSSTGKYTIHAQFTMRTFIYKDEESAGGGR
jgi:type IV pilus assembly protein PilO